MINKETQIDMLIELEQVPMLQQMLDDAEKRIAVLEQTLHDLEVARLNKTPVKDWSSQLYCEVASCYLEARD